MYMYPLMLLTVIFNAFGPFPSITQCIFCQLLSLNHHHQSHKSKHHCLEPGVLAEHDSNVSNHGDVATNTANNILRPVEIILV